MGDQRRGTILLLILVSLAVSITEIGVSNAQPGTLVVPDDYPTIADAIGNATDGDTIFVKKGTYDGPINQTLVIDKTISLIGEDPESTILNMHPRWIPQTISNPIARYAESIEILADNVKISSFTINGKGLFITYGTNTQINRNNLNLALFLYGSNEQAFQNNFARSVSVDGVGDTIAQNSFIGGDIELRGGSMHIVHDNVLVNGSGIGVITHKNLVFNNTVTNCTHAILIGRHASNNLVYENILTNNEIGLQVSTDGTNNTLYSNYVANNSYGAAVRNEGTIGDDNILYHNNFVDNIEQVNTDSVVRYIDGREAKAYHGGTFDNGEEGNYWSDYTGADADGDGIGDSPYIIDVNRTDNYPLMQPVAIPLLQPPELSILSPQNITYATDNVSLNFTVNKETLWMGYSLDDEDNVTITGNMLNLTGLANGVHTLTVYANGTSGNTVASETVSFTIAKEAEPEPNPISWTVTAAATAVTAIVGAVFLIYYTKTRKTKKKQNIFEA